jgi:DNA-binding HxlR family transcriptional regulator
MKNAKKMITMLKMRSPCPIANTLDILGDKWTLLIIRDAFAGKTTYGDFQISPENIPTNILADRLKRLVEYGILEKKPYQQRPVRYAYRLTGKGRLLGPVLKEIIHWGKKNIIDTEAKIKLGL